MADMRAMGPAGEPIDLRTDNRGRLIADPSAARHGRTDKQALSTTAVKLLDAVETRRRAVIRNESDSLDIRWGYDSQVATTGFLLGPDEAFPIYSRGEVWAVAVSGAPTASVADEWD